MTNLIRSAFENLLRQACRHGIDIVRYMYRAKQCQIVLSSFIVAVAMTFTSAVQAATGDAKKILVLGDSLSAAYGIELSQGWVQQLQDRLVEQQCSTGKANDGCVSGEWSVVNASISGETIGGGLRRLPRLLENTQPDVVLVELGGNDGLRGYPVQRMRVELKKIIELSQEAGANVLLAGMMIPPNYGPAYSDAFAALYPDLSKELDVPLVPFLLDKVVFTEGFMQQDRIHPTAKAQTQILDNVWPELRSLLREVSKQDKRS